MILLSVYAAVSKFIPQRRFVIMNTNEEPGPAYVRWRRRRGSLAMLAAAFGERLGRLADRSSPSNARATKRQVRRWLSANGLTLVLVSAMMIIAWIVAER